MKVGGKDIKAPVEEVLVFPRGDDSIVFRARGLSDMDMFEALCPLAKPPGKLTKDGWVPQLDDPSYRDILANHQKKRLAYMVIHSLAPSEIEWEKVKPDDPSTWSQWDVELKEAGLTQIEINRIIALVLEANCLSEERLRAARESFQRGHQPV